MATVTRTIISGGGGNYVSITLHEAATNLNGGADIWKGVISDTAAYDESVTFDQDGTSDSSYYWLTVDAADRHSGIWTTSKARLVNSGGDTAAFTITGDRVRIGELLMNRSDPGVSDECIRNSGGNNVLLENMVFHGDGSVRDTDGVYTTSTSTPTRFVNCIAYGFGRTGFHDQSSGTRTNRFDHCLSVLNGQNTSSDHYGNIGASNSSTTTWEMYNTVAIELGSPSEVYEIRDNGSTTTLNGAYIAVTADSTTYVNQIDTDNATNWVEATDGLVDTAPATAGVYITETALATFDATPVDHANNVLIDGGVAQTGGDARANLALDIAGSVRPTSGAVDVGPFQITTSGATALSGTASAELTTQGAATRTVGLSGSVTAELTTSGAGSRTHALSGSVAAELTTQGQASTEAPATALSGTVAAELTTQAQGSRTHALSGSAAAELTTQGAASRTHALSGSAAAELTTQGAASRTHALSGSVAAELTTQGQASTSTATALSGTASAELTTSGAATRTVGLSGSVAAELTTQGSATRLHALSGSVAAELTTQGEADTATPATVLSGSVSAELTTSGAATRLVSLSGSVLAELTTAGLASRLLPLSGTVAAELTASASASTSGNEVADVTHSAVVSLQHAVVASLSHDARVRRI